MEKLSLTYETQLENLKNKLNEASNPLTFNWLEYINDVCEAAKTQIKIQEKYNKQ